MQGFWELPNSANKWKNSEKIYLFSILLLIPLVKSNTDFFFIDCRGPVLLAHWRGASCGGPTSSAGLALKGYSGDSGKGPRVEACRRRPAESLKPRARWGDGRGGGRRGSKTQLSGEPRIGKIVCGDQVGMGGGGGQQPLLKGSRPAAGTVRHRPAGRHWHAARGGRGNLLTPSPSCCGAALASLHSAASRVQAEWTALHREALAANSNRCAVLCRTCLHIRYAFSDIQPFWGPFMYGYRSVWWDGGTEDENYELTPVYIT